jgi:hypothetical protein
VGRRQHEFGYALPIVVVDVVHVLAEAVVVHRDFRMHVASHERLGFVADSAIAQRGSFSATSHNTDMLGQGFLPVEARTI